MATVRKLVTKLKFEADTTQAEKFERKINNIRTTLEKFDKLLTKFVTDTRKIKPPEVPTPPQERLSAWQKFREKLKNAIDGIRKRISESKIGSAITNWGKRFATAMGPMKKVVTKSLGALKSVVTNAFKGITTFIRNNKFKILGVIAGTVAAAKKALTLASTQEQLDITIRRGFGVKDLDKDIADIKKGLRAEGLDFGKAFTDLDIKQAVFDSLSQGIDFQTIKEFLPTAFKLGIRPGQTLTGALSGTAGFAKGTVDEAGLTQFGIIDRDTIEKLKLARTEASNFTNARKRALVFSRILNNSEQINLTALELLNSAGGEQKKLLGEIEQTWSNVGEKLLPKAVEQARELNNIVNDINNVATGEDSIFDFFKKTTGKISNITPITSTIAGALGAGEKQPINLTVNVDKNGGVTVREQSNLNAILAQVRATNNVLISENQTRGPGIQR
jgi:hypothetical protein